MCLCFFAFNANVAGAPKLYILNIQEHAGTGLLLVEYGRKGKTHHTKVYIILSRHNKLMEFINEDTRVFSFKNIEVEFKPIGIFKPGQEMQSTYKKTHGESN